MDVKDFIKTVKPEADSSRIEPYSAHILKLDSMGYSPAQIREWLASNKVQVSEETLSNLISANRGGKGTKPPSKDDVSKAIKALASTPDKRTKIGRIRELIDDIESALNAGIKIEDLVKVLNAQGIRVSKSSFASMLYRVRAEKAKAV